MTQPVDRKYRDSAETELCVNWLLDAGAGTGKTTVLVNRVMSIVREGEGLEGVVAITFTEKAAGELKFRLRAELEKTLAGAGGAGEANSTAKNLRSALIALESAPIGTIHSFAASLLRERPAEALVDPRFEVLDEFDSRILRDEAWEEWIEREMPDPPTVLRDALFLGLGLDNLETLAAKLIDHRDLAQNIAPPGKYPDIGNLKSQLRSVIKKLDDLARACKNKSDSLIGDIESLREFADGFEAVSDPIEAARLMSGFSLRPKGNKSNWQSESARDETKKAIEEAVKIITAFRVGIVSVVAGGLLWWLKNFVAHYEARKAGRGALDFHDLLLKARDLLKNNKGVRKYFQERCRRLLVDEFQDTDPLQVEIVFYLAENGQGADRWEDCVPAPGKLFIVGDPKQSIYAFRRADLRMYNEVENYFARHGEKAPLIQNFRSTKSVVQWVNGKFSRLFGETGSDRGPAYMAIEASRNDPGEGIKTGVWMLPVRDLDYEAKKISTPNARILEAATIAAFLKDIIGKWKICDKNTGEWRAMKSSDVALLFRTRTDIQIFERTLRALDIPYVVPGGSAFYMAAEVLALLDCLKAIDRPDDPVALIGALRSPFFGFSDEEIFLARHHGMKLDYTRPLPDHPHAAAFKEAFRLLNDLHAKRNQGRMAALIGEFCRLTLGPALFMLKPSGEQRLANILKVIERARRFDRSGAMTFGEFVEHLEQAEDILGEEEAPIVEGEDDFVRLMTIHGAKGLEFPMVIIANMTLTRQDRNEPVCDRRSGRIEFNLNGIQTAGWDDAWEEWGEILDAEDVRLLYVACTRARDYLVLPVPQAGLPKKGYTLPLIKEQDLPDFIKINTFNSESLAIETPKEKPFRLHGTRKAEQDSAGDMKAFLTWSKERRREIEGLSRPGNFRSVTEIAKKESGGEPVRAENAATRFGTFVHDILGRVDPLDPGDIREIARAIAADYDINEAEIAEAVAMTHRAMSAPVWKRAINAGRMNREYPLFMSDPAGMTSGRPDLVFFENGKLVVVDYKTDNLLSRDEAEEKMKESYREQGNLYARALNSITGIPVKEIVFLFLKPDPPIEIS